MATMEDPGEDANGAMRTPSDAGLAAPVEPLAPRAQNNAPQEIHPVETLVARNLNFGEGTSAQAIIDAVGENREKVTYRELLAEPIDPNLDPIALDVNRQKLLAEAKEIAKINSQVLKNKIESDKHYQDARRLKDQALESIKAAEATKKRLETHIKEVQEHKRKLREAVPPRNLNFNNTAKKPLATPKDNMLKAHELLANGGAVDINYLKEIIGTAVKQQSRADTANKLASKPDACASTARYNPKKDYRDNHSTTASPQHRRREGDYYGNPIKVPSHTPAPKENRREPSQHEEPRNKQDPPRHLT